MMFKDHGCGFFPPDKDPNCGIYPPDREPPTLTEAAACASHEVKAIVKRLMDFEERLKAECECLLSTVSHDNVIFKTTFNECYQEFTNSILEKVQGIEDTTATDIALFVEETTAKLDTAKAELNEICNEFTDTITGRIEQNNASCIATINAALTSLTGKITKAENTLLEDYNTFTNATDTKIAEQDAQIDDAVVYLKTNLILSLENLLYELKDEGVLVGMVQTEVFVTPEMYGAKGDGVTDDTTSIQAAINRGVPVHFGNKTYICRGVSTKGIKDVNLIGVSGTVIKWGVTTTAGLRGQFAMITDDDGASTPYIGGNVHIENITFDGNADNITAFPVTSVFGLCGFYARDNINIVNCTFRNCHADGVQMRGLMSKANVKNCTFVNLGQVQPADGTRNGMTITRAYYARDTHETVVPDGNITVLVEGCTFDTIADECVRVDGVSAFTLNNCFIRNIGQHILETGHTTDKTDYVFTISNCVAENVASAVYESGADGGGVFEHNGNVYILNSIFKGMCWTGCAAMYVRKPHALIANGFTTGIKPNITIDGCSFTSETGAAEMENQATMYMVSGENVTFRNTTLDYAYINVGQIFPCESSMTFDKCVVRIDNEHPDYYIYMRKAHGEVKIIDSKFEFGRIYKFIQNGENNTKIRFANSEFKILDDKTGYAYIWDNATLGVKVYVTECIFDGKLTGRFVHNPTTTESYRYHSLYIVGNNFPTSFCAWGTLVSHRGGGIDVIVNNDPINA